MPSTLALLGLGVVVGVHSALAAVLVRLIRVRLETRWGAVVYSLALVPIVLLLSTLAVSGALGLGPNLGGPAAAIFVMVVVPLGVGLTIDYVWMPAPEEVELPDTL